jgi:hypothetical protein
LVEPRRRMVECVHSNVADKHAFALDHDDTDFERVYIRSCSDLND